MMLQGTGILANRTLAQSKRVSSYSFGITPKLIRKILKQLLPNHIQSRSFFEYVAWGTGIVILIAPSVINKAHQRTYNHHQETRNLVEERLKWYFGHLITQLNEEKPRTQDFITTEMERQLFDVKRFIKSSDLERDQGATVKVKEMVRTPFILEFDFIEILKPLRWPIQELRRKLKDILARCESDDSQDDAEEKIGMVEKAIVEERKRSN